MNDLVGTPVEGRPTFPLHLYFWGRTIELTGHRTLRSPPDCRMITSGRARIVRSQSPGSERVTKIPDVRAEADVAHTSPIRSAPCFVGEPLQRALAEERANPVRSGRADLWCKETENGHPSALRVAN